MIYIIYLTKTSAAFLAVGGLYPQTSSEHQDNIKTEIYSEISDTWTTLQDYPYAGMRLFQETIN